MVRFLLLLLVLAPQGGADSDVQVIVRGVEARYRNMRTLKSPFLHRYAEARNDLRLESGTVYLARGGRMRWEYESPETKLFLSDGKTVWFYVPSDRTVTRAPLKQSADWETPIGLLVGKAKFSKVCGLVEYADVKVSASGNRVLRCVPKSKKESFSDALVEVDADYRLVRVLIREPGGVETEFRFGNWVENLPLSESLFHFAAPQGVAIVDESSIAGPLR